MPCERLFLDWMAASIVTSSRKSHTSWFPAPGCDPRLSCGIVAPIPARNIPALMRRAFDGRRLLMNASSVAVLWLLCASLGNAAPAPPRAAAGRSCDAKTTTLRKLSRPPKSAGGPLKAASAHTLAGFADSRQALKRASHPDIDDDGQAIQNDAPAARIEVDERPAPTLRELGILPSPHRRRVHTRAFTPRSPRGPPFFG
jgi:hypothetical protein